MNFTEASFFLFFALVAPLYFILPQSKAVRFLTLSSYFFYGAWDIRFVPILLTSTLTDFYCGRKVFESEGRRRRFFLWLSIGVNLSILCFFKYVNFFIDPKASNSGFHLDIVLPVGISFFTFQSMSYTIDIYRRKLKPEPSMVNFFCYVSLFSQLVAGPIVRARKFLPQLQKKNEFSYKNLMVGSRIFAIGLFKKVAVADVLGRSICDPYFAQPENYSGPMGALALSAFIIQIYADFSGYCDMAIGSARILGFRLPQNFNNPFLTTSLTVFWTRWHMTLMSWLKDYVFHPTYRILKESDFVSRMANRRRHLFFFSMALMVTMFLSGAWHGSQFFFIVWGLYNGVVLLIERLISLPQKLAKLPLILTPIFFLYPFAIFAISAAFFRVESFDQSLLVLSRVFSFAAGDTIEVTGLAWIALFSFFASQFYHFLKMNNLRLSTQLRSLWNRNWILRSTSYFFAISYILFFLRLEKNPFIYFQF